ncbi:MAG: TetR/AcrR family transcriptional regulator [Firmicutes bacterium]|jgi:AcrR family transcriptional regulator|nr:TetR/AcrR family transcriptional regulator [Bacillota bacterium]
MNTTQEDQILEAAYTCIAREGYANVSLRQIAQEADVAVSQISYHFKNKEGLLLAVISQAAERYNKLLQENLALSESHAEKGHRLIALFKDALLQERSLFKVIYDSAGLALFSETFRVKMREVFSGIMEQIVQEIEAVAHSDSEAAMISRLVFSLYLGTAIQYLLEPEDPAVLGSLDLLERLFK